jgi:type II secretory pathway pseudopilin PulG
LLVVIGIITVLVAIIMPIVGRGRASAQSAACLSQLHQIAAGLLMYADDNDRRLPDPFELQTSWEQILRRYVSNPETFRCPGDSELYPAIGSSYDWRDTGTPETTLAGKAISDTTRNDCVLAFEALPGWHARGRMNAALLDGSAVSMDQEQCMADIQLPIRAAPADDGRQKLLSRSPPNTAGAR